MKLPVPTPDQSGAQARRAAAIAYVRGNEPASDEKRRVREVLRVLDDFAALPSRELLLLSVAPEISATRMLRLYDEGIHILETLDLDGEYRKRSSRPR